MHDTWQKKCIIFFREQTNIFIQDLSHPFVTSPYMIEKYMHVHCRIYIVTKRKERRLKDD